MRRLDPVLLSILSELFVNLAAGWYGAILIIPNFTPFRSILDLLILTIDGVFGTLCLIVAFWLRKKAGKYKEEK